MTKLSLGNNYIVGFCIAGLLVLSFMEWTISYLPLTSLLCAFLAYKNNKDLNLQDSDFGFTEDQARRYSEAGDELYRIKKRHSIITRDEADRERVQDETFVGKFRFAARSQKAKQLNEELKNLWREREEYEFEFYSLRKIPDGIFNKWVEAAVGYRSVVNCIKFYLITTPILVVALSANSISTGIASFSLALHAALLIAGIITLIFFFIVHGFHKKKILESKKEIRKEVEEFANREPHSWTSRFNEEAETFEDEKDFVHPDEDGNDDQDEYDDSDNDDDEYEDESDDAEYSNEDDEYENKEPWYIILELPLDILEEPSGVKVKAIKAAYKQRMLEYHRDRVERLITDAGLGQRLIFFAEEHCKKINLAREEGLASCRK